MLRTRERVALVLAVERAPFDVWCRPNTRAERLAWRTSHWSFDAVAVKRKATQGAALRVVD